MCLYMCVRLCLFVSRGMGVELVAFKLIFSLYTGVYVCIVITYNKSKDQPGKVANPARGQLNSVCEALNQHARA